MTHAPISASDLRFWVLLIALQIALALYLRKPRFLRVFLAFQSLKGIAGIVCIFTLSQQAYFNSWLVRVYLNEAISLYFLFSLMLLIRRHALPSRQSLTPILAMFALSGSIAILMSPAALAGLTDCLRLTLAWDQVVWSAICWMLCLTPLYAFLVSATIPTQALLTLGGFGLYAAGSSGFVAALLLHFRMANHLSDYAYCLSLVLWLISGYTLNSSTSGASYGERRTPCSGVPFGNTCGHDADRRRRRNHVVD